MTGTISIVPLADLKAHLNVTAADDDAMLTGMLEAARLCGRLVRTTLDDMEGGAPAAV